MVGDYKEIGSGVKLDRAERKKVMALAQKRQIDPILLLNSRARAEARSIS